MANPNTIPLLEGEQLWLLLATDKFGISADDLVTDHEHGLAVALRAILSQAKGQSGGMSPWEEWSTGNKTFRLGTARPIEVLSVSKTMPALAAGKTLADRMTYPGEGIPTVVGQQPWYVLIRLWWRAPNEQLPWPAFTSFFPLLPGLEDVNGAEWVLAKAVLPTAKTTDPGEQSWGAAQSERIKTAAATVEELIEGAVVLGLLWYLSQQRQLWPSSRRERRR
jgi:hypothetical protein